MNELEATITCVEHSDVQVRLHDYAAFDEDIATISAELRAPGLEAALLPG